MEQGIQPSVQLLRSVSDAAYLCQLEGPLIS